MDALKPTCVYRQFAGKRVKFELRIGDLLELERLCGSGIGAIYLRLAAQPGWLDIREPIRLGMLGGGMAEPDVDMLMLAYVDKGPIGRLVPLAYEIVNALFNGVDEPPKKAEGETSESQERPATAPPGMSSAAPSDLSRAPSIG